MNHSELQQLFRRYKEGGATPGEIKTLMEMLKKPGMEGVIKELLGQEIEELEQKPVPEGIDLSEERIKEILGQILAEPQIPVIKLQDHTARRNVWRYVAAAVVVLAVGAGALLIMRKTNPGQPVARQEIKTDIPPGHDGAILTLADGRTIVLDNTQNGKVTDVAVKNGSQLSYADAGAVKVEYNTMSTPRGRQFTLVLADGTRVWLNAASSITYPTAFNGNDRKVSITGEAYFEVAHDASKPFIVSKGKTSVQVLGTHFNVNAYDDEEAIKVTLLQGSVKVANTVGSVLIKPGEQAALTINHKPETRNHIDLDAVMAWKNGYFNFSNTDLHTVMRQVSRWYDVEVIYEGAISNEEFMGGVPRQENISALLKVLEGTEKVHFKLDGKKVIVMP